MAGLEKDERQIDIWSISLRRNTDPIESALAAKEIVPFVGRMQQVVTDLVTANPGLTCRELARIRGDEDLRTVGRRLNECERLGTIRRGESRPCSTTGRLCATWFPVVAQREWVPMERRADPHKVEYAACALTGRIG